MLGLAFLALAAAAGLLLAFRLVPDADHAELWVTGPIIGIAGAFWVVFAASVPGGRVTPATILVAGLAIGAATLMVAYRQPLPPAPPRWLLLVAAALLPGLVAFNLFGVLWERGGTVTVARDVWADIALHTSIASSFAYGQNVPPEYPMVAGTPLAYPFYVDLAIGTLAAAGLSLSAAFVTVYVLIHLGILLGVVLLARAVFSLRTALLATGMLVLLGNLGVLAIPSDVGDAGGWTQWMRELPWDYSADPFGEQGRARIGIGMYLGNPLVKYVGNRPSGAFGLALGIAALVLVWRLRSRPSVGLGVLAGLAAGLTPRVHAHSSIALFVIVATWLALDLLSGDRGPAPVRAWTALVATAAVVALPQVLSMLGPTTGFVEWGWLGWTGESREALLALVERPGAGTAVEAVRTLVVFWVVNAGLPLLLVVPALLAASTEQRRWYTGFAVLWLVANLVKTQPFEYDNSSYFVYWQIGTVVVAAAAIRRLLVRGLAMRVAALAAVAVITAGGVLAFTYTFQRRLQVWSSEHVAFAELVRAHVPAGDVVLTAPGHLHPVFALSGRQVVLGGAGSWFWTHGIDVSRHERDVQLMLAGDLDLMDRYGVQFVVVGPWERGYVADHGVTLAAELDDPMRFERVAEAELFGDEWVLLRARRP